MGNEFFFTRLGKNQGIGAWSGKFGKDLESQGKVEQKFF